MLLRPHLIVQAVHHVTPALLLEHGCRAVMVDLDDTLVASHESELEPSFAAWVTKLKEAGIPIIILSNGRQRRVAKWSQALGVPGLSLVGKPFTFAFQKGLKLLGSRAGETAMIGDQLFTDVLGANLLGLTSILVTPLSTGGLPHHKAVRKLERLVLKGSTHEPSLEQS